MRGAERPVSGILIRNANFRFWPNSAVQQPMAGSSVWTSGVAEPVFRERQLYSRL
jgi:hypothetical protein